MNFGINDLGMNDLLIIVFRTFFFYFLVALVYRMMGKRELGQLSVFDFLVSLMVAEIIAISIDNVDDPLIHAVIPIVLVTLLQIVISLIALKSKKVRDLFDGKPTVIIREGMIDKKAMQKQRYNLDDLYLQLRQNNVVDIHDVEYAILETNGKLSIVQFKKNPAKVFPLPIIIDGDFVNETLDLLGINESDVLDYLRKENTSIQDVFIMYLRKGNFNYIKK